MDDSSKHQPESSLPLADVESKKRPWRWENRLTSRLWIVTFLCLCVAIWLVWSEISSSGTRVEILFPEGHGLTPGNPVLYRGIKVGEVLAVGLTEDLACIEVSVQLFPSASSLAREGTRFWIERPDVRIGRVRGLETLIGGRHVGVSPGSTTGKAQTGFEGLSEAPTTIEHLNSGLAIILESQHRSGLQKGSPITYRGIEVGQILGVGLTNDSANVVARAVIEPQYRALVRENTRFWSNSGIGIRLGLTGFEIDAETLTTIASGGVALATPSTPEKAVGTGHRFTVNKSPEEEWLNWQPLISIGSAVLPDNSQVPQPELCEAVNTDGFTLFGRTQRRGWLLPVEPDRVLGPRDLLLASENNASNILEAWGEEITPSPDGVVSTDLLTISEIPELDKFVKVFWPLELIRIPTGPEEVAITCGSDDMTLPVLPERMTTMDNGWVIDPSVPVDEAWHGASVVAASDGKLVGILIHSEQNMLVAPLSEQLLEPLD